MFYNLLVRKNKIFGFAFIRKICFLSGTDRTGLGTIGKRDNNRIFLLNQVCSKNQERVIAKKNIRVKVPIPSPLKFLQLAKRIFSEHKNQGENSPLKHLDMTGFENKVTEAEEKRVESKSLRAQSESLMEQAKTIMGLKPDQSSHTPDTIYNLMTYIKNYLLVYYHGNEGALAEWGFDVTIKASVYNRRKDSK